MVQDNQVELLHIPLAPQQVQQQQSQQQQDHSSSAGTRLLLGKYPRNAELAREIESAMSIEIPAMLCFDSKKLPPSANYLCLAIFFSVVFHLVLLSPLYLFRSFPTFFGALRGSMGPATAKFDRCSSSSAIVNVLNGGSSVLPLEVCARCNGGRLDVPIEPASWFSKPGGGPIFFSVAIWYGFWWSCNTFSGIFLERIVSARLLAYGVSPWPLGRVSNSLWIRVSAIGTACFMVSYLVAIITSQQIKYQTATARDIPLASLNSSCSSVVATIDVSTLEQIYQFQPGYVFIHIGVLFLLFLLGPVKSFFSLAKNPLALVGTNALTDEIGASKLVELLASSGNAVMVPAATHQNQSCFCGKGSRPWSLKRVTVLLVSIVIPWFYWYSLLREAEDEEEAHGESSVVKWMHEMLLTEQGGSNSEYISASAVHVLPRAYYESEAFAKSARITSWFQLAFILFHLGIVLWIGITL